MVSKEDDDAAAAIVAKQPVVKEETVEVDLEEQSPQPVIPVEMKKENENSNKKATASAQNLYVASQRQKEDESDAPYYAEGHVPETESWFPLNLYFFWVGPMFRRAASLHKQGKALEHEDLLPLPIIDHGATYVFMIIHSICIFGLLFAFFLLFCLYIIFLTLFIVFTTTTV